MKGLCGLTEHPTAKPLSAQGVLGAAPYCCRSHYPAAATTPATDRLGKVWQASTTQPDTSTPAEKARAPRADPARPRALPPFSSAGRRRRSLASAQGGPPAQRRRTRGVSSLRRASLSTFLDLTAPRALWLRRFAVCWSAQPGSLGRPPALAACSLSAARQSEHSYTRVDNHLTSHLKTFVSSQRPVREKKVNLGSPAIVWSPHVNPMLCTTPPTHPRSLHTLHSPDTAATAPCTGCGLA